MSQKTTFATINQLQSPSLKHTEELEQRVRSSEVLLPLWAHLNEQAQVKLPTASFSRQRPGQMGTASPKWPTREGIPRWARRCKPAQPCWARCRLGDSYQTESGPWAPSAAGPVTLNHSGARDTRAAFHLVTAPRSEMVEAEINARKSLRSHRKRN